ncbi:GntR family transcriptional regulator [Frankia sp. CNm7]|uniref:GntR family transcriptional regulator n=1 Tax=Frankia nepalensis TaxID=1836974 RepID=A0A937RFX8_9ACTN|nr:GntR family transcriptional regulator [Frankia nepalensis]MBL7495803.1 GntR family transcriptional regulator [Frankia nepalensis]MBL7513263.1 GntR family transcriptional regulator [Frankia nepalensis]MBL7523785.1 GntR family transcriptional regulator [Frankia nepalensis]MBL7628144.1 GntR family transcriptional regulator [Frankia nepalensis]
MSADGPQLLRDTIAAALRSEIVAGALRPGERIREERIASEHGVSRVPVREALQRLAQEGFLVLTPRRGATVATPSPRRALELMAIRSNLEVLAAQLAARRRGGSAATELAHLVELGTAATAERRYSELPALIDRFHDLVAVGSGNGELVELLRTIRSKVRWMFEVDVEERSTMSWAHHAEIVDAILRGDERAAAMHMVHDVDRDEALYRHLAPMHEVGSG